MSVPRSHCGRSLGGSVAVARRLRCFVSGSRVPSWPFDAVQQAALEALIVDDRAETADRLLRGWAQHSPTLRNEIMDRLLGRPAWTLHLLDAVESERVPARQVSLIRQQRLLGHSDKSVQARAVRLFAQTRPDRQSVLKEYEKVLDLTGNGTHGKGFFREHCSTCHSFKGEGSALGPDMETFNSKTVMDLVVAVMDPNRAVEAPFVNYEAEMQDGQEWSGIIVSETSNSLVLRAPGGTQQTLLRRDLKELTSAGLSLMPEGLEAVLKPQDVADLIAYLRE